MKTRRETVAGSYHVLHAHDCPTEMILQAAQLATGPFVVENIHPIQTNDWERFTVQLTPADAATELTVRSYSLDAKMELPEFTLYADLWDRNGVYAVAVTPAIPFRASELDDLPRFRALDNFAWTLEIAIPGPSGPDWGTFTSPDISLIDRLAELAG